MQLALKMFVIFQLYQPAYAKQPNLAPNPIETNNLVLNLFGEDTSLIQARVLAAVEAVYPDGSLILDYAPKEILTEKDRQQHGLPISIEQALVKLTPDQRKRIFITRFAEPYPWIRDSSYGWQKTIDHKVRINAYEKGNQGGVFSAASIVTLLNSCRDSELAFPKIRKVPLQEGMLVSNGHGLCVANKRVEERNHEGEDYSILKDLGCEKVIYSLDWEDWRKQGHPNGHIDMSVAFVSPKVAIIPKLDSNCKTKFKTGWVTLRKQLKDAGVDTIAIPVATGCIGPEPVVRTYSNMVVMKNSILLAKFLPTDPKDIRTYDKFNDQAVEILEKAMQSGKIPKKKIVQFPIAQEIQGGSVHCMTFNIPGPLHQCSQVNLDSAITTQADTARKVSSLLMNAATKQNCASAADLISTLKFIKNNIGSRTLRTPTNDEIKLSEVDHKNVAESLEALSSSFKKACISSQ